MCTSVYDFLCDTLCRYCGTLVITQDSFEFKTQIGALIVDGVRIHILMEKLILCHYCGT